MGYYINGRKVTKEEWDADTERKKAMGVIKPIQHGDRLTVKAFTGFESPIDGSWIGSREQLRDHEKKHNVKQVGNDFASSMEKRKEQFEERKRESKEQEKDFLYTDINNPTKDIGDHYGKPSDN